MVFKFADTGLAILKTVSIWCRFLNIGCTLPLSVLWSHQTPVIHICFLVCWCSIVPVVGPLVFPLVVLFGVLLIVLLGVPLIVPLVVPFVEPLVVPLVYHIFCLLVPPIVPPDNTLSDVHNLPS